jgi:hypothetical protein
LSTFWILARQRPHSRSTETMMVGICTAQLPRHNEILSSSLAKQRDAAAYAHRQMHHTETDEDNHLCDCN